MTINIAIVTAEAIVLGCDSIATTTAYLLDPFEHAMSDNDDGSITVSFELEHLVPTVTNAWDGVTKMFELSRWPPVAAVTAGLAKLNGLPMSSLANEFASHRRSTPVQHGPGEVLPDSVEQVAAAFLAFMRERYDTQYALSSLPEQFREGPGFLVGGFGVRDPFPSLFQLDVEANTCLAQYSNGESGAAWGGQSDAVERLLRGYDTDVRARVDAAYGRSLHAFRMQVAESIAKMLCEVLGRPAGHDAPEEVQAWLPELSGVNAPWNCAKLSIQFTNLPLQDAVDLAAFLVNLQSGRAKFGPGVATVGGRTHIGVVTKQKFEMIGEPELRHNNTGFLS